MIKRQWSLAVGLGLLLITLSGFAPDSQGRGHGQGHGPGNGGPGPGGPGPGKPPAPPTANDDNATTPENTLVTVNVVANDTDDDNNLNVSTVDLDPATDGIQAAFTSPKGDYTVDADGVVTFTPATNISGPADINYTVNDSTDLTSNPARIHIDVTKVNTPPVAANDVGSTTNDKSVDINVVANDTDSDGTIDTSKVDLNLTLSGTQKNFTSPEGKWSANKGSVKFTPNETYTGTAVISYQVYDNEDAPSNSATISVTVTSANAAPVAVNDNAGTTLNKAVNVNVVANDTDSDGTIDPSKVDLNTGTAGVQNTANTAQGSFSVNAQGVVTYTPIALFLGTATLNYTVMDNDGAVSNAATITITVQAINIAPVAVNDNATTTKNKAVTIKVTQNDTDIDGTVDASKVDLSPTLAGIQTTIDTDQGNYAVNNQGVVTYTPANNFTGIAAQQYVVPDNTGALSNVATINITVQNVNSPPVAVDDTGATSANAPITVNVVSNDTDSDGVVDAAKVDLNPTVNGIQNTRDTPQGSFSVNNIGIVTYDPKKDFSGSVSINYTVSDNNGAVSNVAKITIAVQPINAPVAVEDRATTKVNIKVDINVVANDTDSDGTIDATTVDLNTASGIQKTFSAPEGLFEVNDQGIVTYTPKKDFFGATTIQYTVEDNKGVVSNSAAINVTVTEVPNVAPVITAFEEPTDTLRYTPGNPMAFTEVFDAEDQDDDSLAVAEIGFVTESFVSGADKLLYTDRTNIKGTFNAQLGVLTMSGAAKISDYVNAVRSVKFETTATGEDGADIKDIYVRVSDGTDFSDLKTRVISINSGVTKIDIPTAFTPNSDGANDTWRILAPTDITGADFADAEIRVYDKRGTMVFGANGFGNTWDGTFQGKQLPTDTYYYTIDLKQQQKRYKGIVAILR
ncbi:MAG: Ig-like domain-containing protein [Bacteroidota bacterium]